MRTRPARPAVVAGLAVGALLLGACGETSTSAPAPSDVPSPASTLVPAVGDTGNDGLTVRYLDHGNVKTVRVEDFPR